MTKIYSNDIKIIKRKSKWRKVPIIIIGILAIAVLGEVIASIIMFGRPFIFGGSKGYSGYNLYGLSFGEYDTLAQAEEIANKSSLQGAGGYIYESGGKYVVLGCVYKTQADCESIIKDMAGYECKIKNLDYKNVKISSSSFDSTQKQTIAGSLDYLHSLINTMYDNTIKLDKKEITPIAYSNNINFLKSQCKTQVTELMKVNAQVDNALTSNIIDTYIVVIDSLDNCASKLIQTSSASYISKYTLCEVSVETFKLHSSL